MSDQDAAEEVAQLRRQVKALTGISDRLHEEERKHKETEQAYQYAIHRYWQKYDRYGPYWRLFSVMAAFVHCFDEKGNPVSAADHVAKIARETHTQLKQYAEWVKKGEDESKMFFRMEDDLALLRAMHEDALTLLRGGREP